MSLRLCKPGSGAHSCGAGGVLHQTLLGQTCLRWAAEGSAAGCCTQGPCEGQASRGGGRCSPACGTARTAGHVCPGQRARLQALEVVGGHGAAIGAQGAVALRCARCAVRLAEGQPGVQQAQRDARREAPEGPRQERQQPAKRSLSGQGKATPQGPSASPVDTAARTPRDWLPPAGKEHERNQVPCTLLAWVQD